MTETKKFLVTADHRGIARDGMPVTVRVMKPRKNRSHPCDCEEVRRVVDEDAIKIRKAMGFPTDKQLSRTQYYCVCEHMGRIIE